MSHIRHALRVLLCAGALLAPDTASATPLNVDFGSGNAFGGGAPPGAGFGAASGQAGVWNNIVAFNTPSGIVDVDGSATGVSISISADDMGGVDHLSPGDANDLMEDNFFSFGSSWSFSLTGLTDGLYDVYLYEPHHSGVSSGSGSVNGSAFSNINGNFSSGIFVLGSNYHRIDDVAVVGGTLSGVGSSTSFSGLAGLQIVPVPEPGSAALLGLGLTGLAASGRKRRSTP
jgi:hypothetical protein